MVPADPRPLDASLGSADAVDRPRAGAAVETTRRDLVGQAQTKAARFLDKKRGPDLHRAQRRRPAAKKRGPDLHPALRHWVMVGCLQGKTLHTRPIR